MICFIYYMHMCRLAHNFKFSSTYCMSIYTFLLFFD